MSGWEIFNTDHWQVTYRRDSRYPGYLIVSSALAASEMTDLSDGALETLGGVLKRCEVLLKKAYDCYKVIIYRFGFSSGFSLHFHIVSVMLKLLSEIAAHPNYAEVPDGNDTVLFLSREYCERPLTLEEQTLQDQSIRTLRDLI